MMMDVMNFLSVNKLKYKVQNYLKTNKNLKQTKKSVRNKN